jgi:hypothetical protein
LVTGPEVAAGERGVRGEVGTAKKAPLDDSERREHRKFRAFLSCL